MKAKDPMLTVLTALYDGKCVICQASCGLLRALDWRKRIEFVDLQQAAEPSEGFAELSRERLMSEIHVLDAQGTLYAGFAGSRRLLKEVPLGWPLWFLLQLPGADALGRRLYRFIASRRYRLNRLGCEAGGCQLPR